MSIYTHTKSFVASAIVLVCASALAETPEALVKQALQRNPELNFFVAEIAAAKGAVRTAGTFRNPELSSEVGYKNSRDNSGGPAAMARSWLSHSAKPSSIPVELRYAKRLQITIALAELHLQQFRLTLAARVRTLAYGISSAQLSQSQCVKSPAVFRR
jgi:Outer membrane protein